MGFLQSRRDEVVAATQEQEQRRAARTGKPTGPAAAIDPERAAHPGQTLARDPRLPAEQQYRLGSEFAWSPNWSADVTVERVDGVSHATHGRRRAIRICPVCREQRSTEGNCECGSTQPGVRLDGTNAPGRAGQTTRKAPRRDATEWVSPRALAHQRMHPTTVDGCRRCADLSATWDDGTV